MTPPDATDVLPRPERTVLATAVATTAEVLDLDVPALGRTWTGRSVHPRTREERVMMWGLPPTLVAAAATMVILSSNPAWWVLALVGPLGSWYVHRVAQGRKNASTVTCEFDGGRLTVTGRTRDLPQHGSRSMRLDEVVAAAWKPDPTPRLILHTQNADGSTDTLHVPRRLLAGVPWLAVLLNGVVSNTPEASKAARANVASLAKQARG